MAGGDGGRVIDGRWGHGSSRPARRVTRRPGHSVAARPAVLALMATLVLSCRSGSAQERAALYATLPTIAGAELVERTAYDIRDDGWDTGDDELRVVYRLPAGRNAAEVLDELRAGLPDGWTEAGDATCARRAQDAPPPPVPTNADGSPGSAPTPPSAATELLRRATELTAFAPGGEQPDRWEGVTFTFVDRGGEQLLVLDGPQLTCVPPGEQ